MRCLQIDVVVTTMDRRVLVEGITAAEIEEEEEATSIMVDIIAVEAADEAAGAGEEEAIVGIIIIDPMDVEEVVREDREIALQLINSSNKILGKLPCVHCYRCS